MTAPPPLAGVRVLEFAGLAPGPFAGMLLADYGASVLRLDRATSNSGHTDPASPPAATPDSLVRHKASIAVDVKSPAGIALIKALLPSIDVVIDPFRPGVLEKLGLHPTEVMQRINPRLITARVTGYRREGKYSAMAGHDINYIAVSGVLSMLGRQHEKPFFPANILGDFAGGGATCFMGVLLALLARQHTGRGQVVEANMVDGAAYLASMPRLAMRATHGGPAWAEKRGTNMLDGGSPFYDTYETKDDGSGQKQWVSVGALEPQFFAELLRGLGLTEADLPGDRSDRRVWPEMARLFTRRFKQKTRREWEAVFDGTDACVAPVLTQWELRDERGFDQRPIVTLRETPSYAIARGHAPGRPAAQGQGTGVEGDGWTPHGIGPGVGGEAVLHNWMGWQRGSQYEVENGGLVLRGTTPAKL